jgi:hypothetical protein
MENKKVELSLMERFSLIQILPTEGKFEDLIVSEDIKSKIKITQDEIKEFEIRTEVVGDYISTKWNEEKINGKVWSYEFSSLESSLIKTLLKKISDSEKLNLSQLKLYKEFVL